jgi:hypothetical protein
MVWIDDLDFCIIIFIPFSCVIRVRDAGIMLECAYNRGIVTSRKRRNAGSWLHE